MAAKQFHLLLMMKQSPLGRSEWSLGRDVNSSLRTNKITSIVMHNVGSGQGEQWHCFWPVDGVESEKPVLFVELYRELNRWIGEKPSVLNPIVFDKEWDYVDFPITVGDIKRRFACGSLLVLAEIFLDPKYLSMPEDLLQSLRAVQAEGNPPPLTPTNQFNRSKKKS